MPKTKKSIAVTSNDVLCAILGGGAGTRLFPLTKERSKPAVPIAGKYRLVDVPISNCINAGLKRIYILTQFNSASLHRHISQSYKFDHFSGGFVEILAAEQTYTSQSWYEGTADAVRKNLIHLMNHRFDYLLILSGDQLYRMDCHRLVSQHIESGADATVATIPVTRAAVSGFGIMQMEPDHRIIRFEEKPKDAEVQDSLKLPRESYRELAIESDEDYWLASMGIYVFNRKTLLELLDNSYTDFGKHIIPKAITSHKVYSFIFQGYWEDVGTISAFFEANLDLSAVLPRFNFFDMNAPIYTRPRFLPASKINGGSIENSLVSDGCIINHAGIRQSLLGIRSIVEHGCDLHRVVMMGSDFYESDQSIEAHRREGKPRVGIGANTRVENAIIDKNARIGSNCTITSAGKPSEADHPLYFIRDGIVVIPKNGCIPDGTVV